jgi:hypothetical protein
LYVKYATHVYAYLLLAASPYPQFDGRPGYPLDVEIDLPSRQSRLTVAFRLVLAIPALLLAGSLFGASNAQVRGAGSVGYSVGIAQVAAFLGWFACLALGRMPRGLRDSVAWGVGFSAELWAYLFLLTPAYPDCDPAVVLGELPSPDAAVNLDVRDDRRRSRLTVFFRLPLAFPHLVWLTLWAVLAIVAAIANWLVTLLRGRPPVALHTFLSAYVRYQAHVTAFLALTANQFPGFAGTAGSYPVEVSIAPAERQNRWSVGFRLLLAVPAWLLSGAYASLLFVTAILGWFAALVTGKMPRGLRNASAQVLRYSAQVSAYVFVLTDDYPYGGPSHIRGTDEPASAVDDAPLTPPPPAPAPAAAFG